VFASTLSNTPLNLSIIADLSLSLIFFIKHTDLNKDIRTAHKRGNQNLFIEEEQTTAKRETTKEHTTIYKA
jgi:hypothetical protein